MGRVSLTGAKLTGKSEQILEEPRTDMQKEEDSGGDWILCKTNEKSVDEGTVRKKKIRRAAP